MRRKEGQRGFTLIEIIAVLVLLGILASVAIPRFFSMQKDAADKVADSALASAYSALSMGYAAKLIGNPQAPDSPAKACSDIELTGDTITDIACEGTSWGGGEVTITVTYDGGSSSTKTGTWKTP